MWGHWLDKWYLFVSEKYYSFGRAFGVLEAQFKLEWEEHNLDCLSAHQAVHCHSGKKHKWDVSQQHHNQVLFFFVFFFKGRFFLFFLFFSGVMENLLKLQTKFVIVKVIDL